MKGLKVQLPSAVTDNTLRKLEHYVGIEFERGASNGGGDNGYHQMIGDESLLKEMRFHNEMKTAMVKNAAITEVLNQVNWNKTQDGGASVIDGSDGSDILNVFDRTIYAILGGTNAKYERFIVSDEPFSYDGDVAVAITPFGECPDYATVLNNKLRSIRNDGVSGTQGTSYGTSFSSDVYGNGKAGGYPRTNLNRFQYEAYARANNDDKNSNLPYTIVTNQEIELAQALMFIEFRTKNLNACLGHGLSSNASPTSANWGKVTGVRYSPSNDGNYVYAPLNRTVYVNGNNALNFWQIINNNCPLLKIFEAQLSVSNGDSLEAVTDADGNPVQGIADGVMTGIWTKRFTFQVNAATTNGGEANNWTVEVVFRVPIWRGRTRLWGHLSQWHGGYEILNWFDGTTTHHKLFRARSVADLTTDSDTAAKASAGLFSFEKTYEDLGEMPTCGTSSTTNGAKEQMCTKKGITTAIGGKTGGNMGTHENAVVGIAGLSQEGQYTRCGSHLGGGANDGNAVLRWAHCFGAPSRADTSCGSGFRVEISA